MPGGDTINSDGSFFGQNLTAYVRNGTIPESRVDDMATRILASWYFLGQDKDYPAGKCTAIIVPSVFMLMSYFPFSVSFNAFDFNDEVNNKHIDVQADHYKIVREIGAASAVLLKNEKNALPLKKPKNIVLIGNDAGPALRGPNNFIDRGGDDGVLAVGWGSGTNQFPYLITPLEAIQARARQDRSGVSWWLDDFDTAGAASASVGQEVAVRIFFNSLTH